MSGACRCKPIRDRAVQNCRAGTTARVSVASHKRCGDEHAHAHQSRIRDLEPNLSGMKGGIENREDYSTRPLKV